MSEKPSVTLEEVERLAAKMDRLIACTNYADLKYFGQMAAALLRSQAAEIERLENVIANREARAAGEPCPYPESEAGK